MSQHKVTYSHFSQVGEFNMMSPGERQRQLLIRMPAEFIETAKTNRQLISVLCDVDDHELFHLMEPEEAIDVFEAESQSRFTSLRKEHDIAITWLRKNMVLVNNQWAKARIKQLGRKHAKAHREIMRLRSLIEKDDE